jgi:exopolyphosphatase/guanosine-5'-triphosphate,3'-diphosphate pyrophosphatase
MYLILNSDLFGLSRADVQLVGLVARYHRRAFPKPLHQVFNTLGREARVAVSKMAAILRVAKALDATRSQRIRQATCRRKGRRLVVYAPGVDDLSVEQLAVNSSRGLFEQIYGLQVVLRPAGA